MLWNSVAVESNELSAEDNDIVEGILLWLLPSNDDSIPELEVSKELNA